MWSAESKGEKNRSHNQFLWRPDCRLIQGGRKLWSQKCAHVRKVFAEQTKNSKKNAKKIRKGGEEGRKHGMSFTTLCALSAESSWKTRWKRGTDTEGLATTFWFLFLTEPKKKGQAAAGISPIKETVRETGLENRRLFENHGGAKKVLYQKNAKGKKRPI